jgi:hypothetical protein
VCLLVFGTLRMWARSRCRHPSETVESAFVL